jgi:hypothetical protein
VDGDLPQLTPAHLRRAEELCPRRLAAERDARRNRNRLGDARFAVANRIEQDVVLAHATMRAARPSDFPDPTDLWPEQQRHYRAAAAGYVTLFADAPGMAVDPGAVDPWGTDVADAGLRLTGSVGVVLEVPDGGAEVRRLSCGPRGFGHPLLDDVDIHHVALRVAPWRSDGPLRVVAAELLQLRVEAVVLDLGVALPAARAFLADRAAHIDVLVATPRPRPGADCAGCGFVAGCDPHR